MSPYKARASDPGIGVADIASTCGAMTTSFFRVSFKLDESNWEVMVLKYNCKMVSFIQHRHNITTGITLHNKSQKCRHNCIGLSLKLQLQKR